MSTVLENLLATAYPDRKADADAADPKPEGPVWPRLTEAERRKTLHAMVRFGGGFSSRLAEAWQRADAINAARLGCAFDDYVRSYGPGTPAYASADRMEVLDL